MAHFFAYCKRPIEKGVNYGLKIFASHVFYRRQDIANPVQCVLGCNLFSILQLKLLTMYRFYYLCGIKITKSIHMMPFKFSSLFFLSFVLFACQPNNADSDKQKIVVNPFFDLKSFFETEIKTHLKNKIMVKKTVTINGKAETKDVEIKDWNEELKPFFNADINKPAWFGKYQMTEKPLSNNSTLKTYQTKEKNLKTKQLSIIQNDSTKNVQLNILTSDHTAVTESDTQLLYDTETGYTISSQQKLLGSNETIVIQVAFLKKE
jgi:hypothetical protein